MFGDMGHGLLMTSAALYLVLRESRILAQKSDNEVLLLRTPKPKSYTEPPLEAHEISKLWFGIADVQHGFCRPLHHPSDGDLLSLHWHYLQ